MRRGVVEASLLVLLAALLLGGVIATSGRSSGAVRQVDRARARAELTAALESRLAEAWWELKRAIPARSRAVPGVRASTGTAWRSQVLGALAERRAALNQSEPVPLPAQGELETPTLHVASQDGLTGLIALRARARGVVLEHRRRYQVTLTRIPGGETLGTVHLLPQLEGVGVGE